MPFIAIYITFGAEDSAKSITHQLIEKRLVACYNVFPMASAYWWQGEIQTDDEFVAIVKTIPEMWDKVVKEVEQLHPYEVPCIMKIEVTANESYEAWVREQVTNI